MSPSETRAGDQRRLADSSLRPFACRLERLQQRGVAQLGSALRSGRRGRRFKSCHPDSKPKIPRPPGGGSSAFPSGTPEGPRRAGGSARRHSRQRDEPPRRAAGGGRGGDAPRRKPTERHAAKRWAAPRPRDAAQRRATPPMPRSGKAPAPPTPPHGSRAGAMPRSSQPTPIPRISTRRRAPPGLSSSRSRHPRSVQIAIHRVIPHRFRDQSRPGEAQPEDSGANCDVDVEQPPPLPHSSPPIPCNHYAYASPGRLRP